VRLEHIVRIQEQDHDITARAREARVHRRALTAVRLEHRHHPRSEALDDARESSVEPSSTTTTSQRGCVCASALSIASPMKRP
jgi:hypothetical protein